MSMTFDDLNLPAVIYAPQLSDGWIKTKNSHWAELEEALRRRDLATAAMIDEAERFAQACDVLRPVMAANPNMTVTEALVFLNEEATR
jgi:hypothetical protein